MANSSASYEFYINPDNGLACITRPCAGYEAGFKTSFVTTKEFVGAKPSFAKFVRDSNTSKVSPATVKDHFYAWACEHISGAQDRISSFFDFIGRIVSSREKILGAILELQGDGNKNKNSSKTIPWECLFTDGTGMCPPHLRLYRHIQQASPPDEGRGIALHSHISNERTLRYINCGIGSKTYNKCPLAGECRCFFGISPEGPDVLSGECPARVVILASASSGGGIQIQGESGVTSTIHPRVFEQYKQISTAGLFILPVEGDRSRPSTLHDMACWAAPSAGSIKQVWRGSTLFSCPPVVACRILHCLLKADADGNTTVDNILQGIRNRVRECVPEWSAGVSLATADPLQPLRITEAGKKVERFSQPMETISEATDNKPVNEALPGVCGARKFMLQAIEEARKCCAEDGRVHPLVGAVAVKDNVVLGKAYRGELAPGDHAEFTLVESKLGNEALAGATIYTTLEPCTSRNHPKLPCAKRLIERRVAHVVIGILDPNPDIRGKGQMALDQAGIRTELFPKDLADQVSEMNRAFIREFEPGKISRESTSKLSKDLEVGDSTLSRSVQTSLDELLRPYLSGGDPKAVSYEDCVISEPINFLHADLKNNERWREKTWALELFFKGPRGERGGTLFSAVNGDAAKTLLLDKVALETLRSTIVTDFLERYKTFKFSINVNINTIADKDWFFNFLTLLENDLRDRNALDRVVIEIPEQPQTKMTQLGLCRFDINRILEFLKYSKVKFAIDDIYSPEYVFQSAADSLQGAVAWRKMDWQYFQRSAVDARETLKAGIQAAVGPSCPHLVIEGVSTSLHKSFLCNEVLPKLGSESLSIQSTNTEISTG